jgi:hypothetical protein
LTSDIITIGLISDTHGLLRPQALAALEGSDILLHAGDIGDQKILDALAEIAPVTAVRGNNDMGAWAKHLPDETDIRIAGITLHLLHDLAQLKIDPVATATDVIVSGHSHRPLSRRDQGVLYINPGSAGPRRFTLPIAVARLRVQDGEIVDELIEIQI